MEDMDGTVDDGRRAATANQLRNLFSFPSYLVDLNSESLSYFLDYVLLFQRKTAIDPSTKTCAVALNKYTYKCGSLAHNICLNRDRGRPIKVLSITYNCPELFYHVVGRGGPFCCMSFRDHCSSLERERAWC